MSTRKKHLPTSSLSELSRQSGIPRNTLRIWRDAGTDIFDAKVLKKRIGRKQPRPDTEAPVGDTGESYQEARRRREIANANRAEIQARREAAELVPVAEVMQFIATVTSIHKNALQMLIGSFPGEAEGLAASEMQKLLRQHCDRIMEMTSDGRIQPDTVNEYRKRGGI